MTSYGVAVLAVDSHGLLRGWGLAAFGLLMLVGGVLMIRIVRARDRDGELMYVHQGSYSLELGLSIMLGTAGLVMLVVGSSRALA